MSGDGQLRPTTCGPFGRANGRFSFATGHIIASGRKAVEGRECALTTGRFREAKFHRPLFGDELKDAADATRPIPALRATLNRTAESAIYSSRCTMGICALVKCSGPRQAQPPEGSRRSRGAGPVYNVAHVNVSFTTPRHVGANDSGQPFLRRAAIFVM